MGDVGLSKIDRLVSDLALLRAELRACNETIEGIVAPFLNEIAAIDSDAEKRKNDIRLAMSEEQKSNPVYQQLGGVIFSKQEKEARLIEEIRAAAVEAYALDAKNKKPARGVKIVVRKNLVYNEEDAIVWCSENMRTAVKVELRKRDFEKHARAVSETLPLPFVTVVESPDVDINTDEIPLYPQEAE